MQIPTNFSAAQAVSIASQTSSRDKAVGDASNVSTDSSAIQNQLEKSQSSSPDRDAQGQGDGLGPRGERAADQNDVGDGQFAEKAELSDSPNGEEEGLDFLC